MTALTFTHNGQVTELTDFELGMLCETIYDNGAEVIYQLPNNLFVLNQKVYSYPSIEEFLLTFDTDDYLSLCASFNVDVSIDYPTSEQPIGTYRIWLKYSLADGSHESNCWLRDYDDEIYEVDSLIEAQAYADSKEAAQHVYAALDDRAGITSYYVVDYP